MAKNEFKFTDAKLKAISHPSEGREEYWDTSCRGLKLRVGKRAKVWYVWGRAKAHGTRTKALPFHHKIGEYPAFSLADAHEEAYSIFRDAGKGIHPREKRASDFERLAEDERAKRKAAQKQDREKFTNVAEIFIEDYAKREKRSWKEDQRVLEKDFIPQWGDRTLDDIEPVEITTRLREIERRAKKAKNSNDGSTALNNSLACIRKLYNWAIANGYATRSPINKGMARGTKGKTRKRDFSDEEVRAIWNACDALPAHAAPAIRLLIVSGQRRGVVMGAMHSEIERANRVWTVSGDAVGRSKNKLDHKIPLTDMMINLIDSVPVVDGVDHIFCSHHRGDKALSLGDKFKKSVDAKCGFSDWTFQALRGLVVTRMRRKPLKIDRDIINMIQGRLPSDIQSENYDSHDYFDEKREALQRWNDHLQRILDDTVGDEDSNAIPFKKASA